MFDQLLNIPPPEDLHVDYYGLFVSGVDGNDQKLVRWANPGPEMDSCSDCANVLAVDSASPTKEGLVNQLVFRQDNLKTANPHQNEQVADKESSADFESPWITAS